MLKILKWIFRIIILLIIAAGLLYIYARHVEPFWLAENEISLSNTDTANTDSLKIGIFSDTHFGEYYSVDNFEKVVEKMNAAKPDVIVFLGDLIDDFNRYTGDTEKISEALARLEAPLGKFAVYGNHDYGGGAQHEYKDIMASGGFSVLVNEYIMLDEYNIAITGIDDFIIGYGDTVAANYAPSDSYNVILCHEPDFINTLLDYNTDLMLAGHTHGGQINIPYYINDFLPPFGQNYLRGQFEFENEQNTVLYVNSGIGMTKLPFRFFARPEITYVTVTPQ